MKGQVGIEFIVLLSIALLISSILIASINQKAVNAEKYRGQNTAEQIAMDTAYKIEYATTQPNKTLKIHIPQEYNVEILNQTVIVTGKANTTYPVNYNKNPLTFNPGKTYKIQKNATGVEIAS